MNQSCKGTKRPATEELSENPLLPEKRPLVDYASSEEEPMEVEPFQPVTSFMPEQPVHTIGPWRAPHQSSDEEESDKSWDSDEESNEEESEGEELGAESSNESWHTAEEELWESEKERDEERISAEELSLDTLRDALPWAQYQGMPEEQFGAATQQMGGNPLFEFEFLPVSEQQWLKRVQKTIYHTRLRQRRAPLDTDDIGVGIVKALEESTREHLTKIGARDEDRVFLALTPNGFEHVYQTTEFKVKEFREGSTRIETLMRKLAGKLNSNESFHPEDGFQLDLTLLRPMGTGSGHGKRLNPGRMGYQMSRNVKKSIVEIRNKDELCCARAIVTMKARAEWKVAEKRAQEEKEMPTLLQKLRTEEKEAFNDYETLRRTPKTNKKTMQLQRTLAQQLHLVAGVPKGPCGRDELKIF